MEYIAERRKLDGPSSETVRIEPTSEDGRSICNEVHARASVPNSDGASDTEEPPTGEEADILGRKNTASQQLTYPELGPIVRMRLASDLKPHLAEVLPESETTKALE